MSNKWVNLPPPTAPHSSARQQLDQGWFKTPDDILQKAFHMPVKQIMRNKAIICSVPVTPKAEAVKSTPQDSVRRAAYVTDTPGMTFEDKYRSWQD